MRRVILFEVLSIILLVFLQKQMVFSPYLGITFYLVFALLILGVRRYIGKNTEAKDANSRDYKFAVILNTLCLAFSFFGINNHLLSLADLKNYNPVLVESFVFMANRLIIPWWILIEMVRLIFGLRLINILVIFLIYLLLGFLASVGFDYMTTAVVLVYAFTTGFLQTNRGKKFKKDYGLGLGEKYSFVDVDFLLAIIFLSYIIVKATGISNIFLEITVEESRILHTIESSLWDGGLMMILSGVLMYILLAKGLIYKIYNWLDRFLRGLMEDLKDGTVGGEGEK